MQPLAGRTGGLARMICAWPFDSAAARHATAKALTTDGHKLPYRLLRKAVWAVAGLMALAGPAAALSCREMSFESLPYTICEIDPAQDDLQLFLKDEQGEVFGSFSAIDAAIGPLSFAMNAGMYHPDRAPVGLYLQEGIEEMRLVTNPGPGNFGLLPNGVFCIGDNRADVVETLRFAASPPDCRFATQSGPMLVIDGDLHPRFLQDSSSRHIRNGVGTSADGQTVVFAISDWPVTFYEFGRLFRDGLGLPQALYFDGNVSRLHAPELGRSDGGFAMGPIVGVLAPDSAPIDQ